jgi:hypothetical protein
VRSEELSIVMNYTASNRSTIMWLFILFTASLVSSASCTLTSSQTVGDKAETMSKVSQELIALYDEYSSYLASHSARAFEPADPLVRVIGNRVVVDAVASVDANVLKADLVSLGMQQSVAFGRIVSGELPISAIPKMAGLTSLKFARAASGALQRGQEPPLPWNAQTIAFLEEEED